MSNSTLKKILCAMLAVMMFLSIAAYGTTAMAEDAYPMGETSDYVLDYGKYADVDWSTKPSFKIGFSWMSSADLLWSMYERSVRYACDVLHCELIFVEWDVSSTTFVSDAIENLCQAGVDGIVSGMMDGASIDACIRANVPFVGALNQMNDEMLKTANESGLFCGNVIDDDYVSTYNSVKALYEAGCRKIAWVAPQPGTTQAEIRSSGIMDALEDYPELEVLTSYRYSTAGGDESLNAIEQILCAYPELEGLVVSNGLDVTSIWYNTGAADRGVKLAVTDLCESYQDLFQDDLIAYCATDQFPSLVIATTLLYNKLTGHEIMADTSVQMRRHFLELHNYEEMCNMWNMSFLNIFPMTAEQVLDLCVEFNPDADEALYTQYAEDYTIENVAASNAHLLEACPVKDRLG
ncbi:MAG: substrate-binding domain-containing protein [Firmicutes bacterium]|nr:substrate-binding domain-containing protein [Bacillota bacterium]MDY6160100.1 substrate-binding domain-containing protein [Candidatus Faecousia sp.]